MTYTQFVSTMNHLYNSKGPHYLVENVEEWFNTEFLGYSIGLLEYCCRELKTTVPKEYRQYLTYIEDDYVLTESMRIMCIMMGKSYIHTYVEKSIPEFIKHKVCITEVGNAI